jgi:hypothetical protein
MWFDGGAGTEERPCKADLRARILNGPTPVVGKNG